MERKAIAKLTCEGPVIAVIAGAALLQGAPAGDL